MKPITRRFFLAKHVSLIIEDVSSIITIWRLYVYAWYFKFSSSVSVVHVSMFLDCQMNGSYDDVRLKYFIYLNYVRNRFHNTKESLLPQSVTHPP